jgi:bacterioferritin-associated ferredoxin
MARVFIFAEQVKKIVRDGKTEIEVPEGARISAAAADVIKDKKLKVTTVTARRISSADALQAEDKPGPITSSAHQAEESKKNASETISKDKETATGDDLSDEDLEALVNRVVERFKQLKGIEPSPSKEKRETPVVSRQTSVGDDDLVICRCEEITKGEIKEAIRNGMRTVSGIKRITRAGMGLCQGQTCQRIVTQIIAEGLGQSPAEIEPTTARGPVRPLRMAVFANR